MASSLERWNSTSSFMARSIVCAFDAIKTWNTQECKDIITSIRMKDEIMQEVDSIKFLGVLDKVLHPMGFQIQIGPESFIGSHARAIEEEISRKLDAYVSMLQLSAKDFESQGVDVEVKIVVGAPLKKIIVQEITAVNATWAILDRQLRKDLNFYLQYIPCKVIQVVNDLSLQVLRPYYLDKRIRTFECKTLHSLSKHVSLPPSPNNETYNHSDISMSVISSPKSSHIQKSGSSPVPTSCTEEEEEVILQDESNSISHQELSGSSSTSCFNKLENKCDDSCQMMRTETSMQSHPEGPTASEITASDECSNSKIHITPDEHPSNIAVAENELDDSPPVILRDKSSPIYPDAPDLSIDDAMNLRSMGFTYSTIQIATDYFSLDNMLGQGRHGIVYRGQFKDGRLTAIKVQKGANTKSFDEFLSQVLVLKTVRHSNIEKLLGYSCKEDLNIMVYEYICNKSLEWHLFDNTEHVLEWHHRHAIAIGTAKGLHFLHKEWWGSPFIHQDIRPSNILLTDDFVPLLGNCSLIKLKTNKCDLQTRSPGNLVYLAPEYAENGICTIKTDVYALGIVLIQLISGQKTVDSTRNNSQLSLTQWALPLVQTLALDELVDPRLDNSYCTYELYSMAKAAYMCIQTNPEIRPTAEEVLNLLEGTNDHLRHVKSNLYPIILSTEASLN